MGVYQNGGVLFHKLQLWMDDQSRSGPEAMAIDEWLLETIVCPVLRVYSWEGEWGSIGYFGKIAEARNLFPGLDMVRRWTGGGIVDHRNDWTYTLVVPKDEFLAKLRGAESYLRIHEKLMETINNEANQVRLSNGSQVTGANVCFENPVAYDLVDSSGRKVAGAGQRRSRLGLLHQGSVAYPCSDTAGARERAEDLAGALSDTWSNFAQLPDRKSIDLKIAARYERIEWLNRR